MSFSVIVMVMMETSRDFKCLLSKVLSGPHVQWSLVTCMETQYKTLRPHYPEKV